MEFLRKRKSDDLMIKLIPVVMATVTRECIYAPSRLRKPMVISYEEFLKKYAEYAHSIQVSFEPDGKSNPQLVTAYGHGLDCWYIIEG